ncbi:hypothetical protein PF003_g12869 [Phytophthora fragariae]|nr:hypothetical protein PF003_g12869 [Phytophthora fragariae]
MPTVSGRSRGVRAASMGCNGWSLEGSALSMMVFVWRDLPVTQHFRLTSTLRLGGGSVGR